MREGTDGLSVTGLDAGLSQRYNVVIWSQRESIVKSEIQVQDTYRLFSEEGARGKSQLRCIARRPCPLLFDHHLSKQQTNVTVPVY